MRWVFGVLAAAALGCATSSDGEVASDAASTTGDTGAADGAADGSDGAADGGDGSGGVCGGAGTACEQGSPLLDVELRNCKGETVRLGDVVCQGKASVVYFGAGWCQPCRAKQPKLQDWYSKHHAEGLQVVTILKEADGPSDPATTVFCDQWAKEYGLEFPVLIDPLDRITSTCLGVGGTLPVTVVTSPAWTVFYKDVGGEATEAEATFSELLAQ